MAFCFNIDYACACEIKDLVIPNEIDSHLGIELKR